MSSVTKMDDASRAQAGGQGPAGSAPRRVRRKPWPPAAFQPLSVAAVLLPAVLFAGGAGWASWQVRGEAEARLVRTVQMLKEHGLRALELQETSIAAIERATRDLGWEEIAASREVHETMRALDAATGVTGGIGLVTPQGRMVAVAARFPLTPVDVSDREYFQAHRPGAVIAPGATAADDRSFVGEVVVSRPRDVPVFSLSRPRRNGTGAGDGVIVTAAAPDYFSGFYAQVAESAGDRVMLFRLDGALLASQPAPDDWSARLSGSVLLPAAIAAVRPSVVDARPDVDGIERLYAVQRLGSYPVAVAYGLDRAVMWKAWIRRVAVLAVVCVVAALLLLALTAQAAAAALRERREAERRAEAEAARADAEAALRQAQRMEALGQLAAGVAHDFRNTVQAVQAGVHLARRALRDGDTGQAEETLTMLSEAAGRGAGLTDRMLSLARRRHLAGPGEEAPAISEPALAVRDACDLLRPLLDDRIKLCCEVEEGVPEVRGDRAEIEAAIVNLVVNARDAMPSGGVIRVLASLQVVGHSDDAVRLTPGQYVRFSVEDSGVGMAPEIVRQAADAFFTTKAPGKGTGLGLATARAFAEEVGGAVQIESAIGCGTTVSLWLPAANKRSV